MLKFIVTLALIGAFVGLIFSRDGREGEDALRGAKKGAKLGCTLGCLYILFFFALGAGVFLLFI